MTVTLPLGFIPLVDTAPLIVAAEFGFAEAEGLHLASEATDLPVASDKAEGVLAAPTPVPSSRGGLSLGRNPFFDGNIFDPAVVG